VKGIGCRETGQVVSKRIRFTKAVATGNDFILIDNRKPQAPSRQLAALAKRLCERKMSIGADGLLVLEHAKKADFKMRIFNPDGSEAEMCGNGSRCAALYASTNGIANINMTIETLAGILNARVKGDIVKVRLTNPKDINWNLCLSIGECPYKLSFIDTGVPHVVYFVKNLDTVDVKKVGADIRYHKEFSPAGANADFVKIEDEHNIKIRTYERGVEDETLACGTGAVASAIISAEFGKLKSPVNVETRSGEKLKVYFDMTGGNFTNVYLEGKAYLVFDGVLT